jgi:hypothetical protein
MKKYKSSCSGKKKLTGDQYLEGFHLHKKPPHCNKCAFPLPKRKKYQSYNDLLFDKRVCNYIERSNTCLPYRDTQERLQTIKARAKYSSQIGRRGIAMCNPPYYYPKN